MNLFFKTKLWLFQNFFSLDISLTSFFSPAKWFIFVGSQNPLWFSTFFRGRVLCKCRLIIEFKVSQWAFTASLHVIKTSLLVKKLNNFNTLKQKQKEKKEGKKNKHLVWWMRLKWDEKAKHQKIFPWSEHMLSSLEGEKSAIEIQLIFAPQKNCCVLVKFC